MGPSGKKEVLWSGRQIPRCLSWNHLLQQRSLEQNHLPEAQMPCYKWAVTRKAFQSIKLSEWFCGALSSVIHFETNFQPFSHGGRLSMSTLSCGCQWVRSAALSMSMLSCALQQLKPSESAPARSEDPLPSPCFSSKNLHGFISPFVANVTFPC